MAAGSPGSVGNAEWGFTPDSSSVATADGTNVGFVEGDIEVSVPREYSFIRLDQVRVELAGICVLKGMMMSMGFGEALQGNLKVAWDLDAVEAGPPTVNRINHDMGGAIAWVANTTPPNYDGSDTRVISLPTAIGIGDASLRIGNSAKQTIGGVTVKAIANSSQLLGTVTDAYA